MNKLEKLLGVSTLGLTALASAGCRSFENVRTESAEPSSIFYDLSDNYISIDEIIYEASRFDAKDITSSNISRFSSQYLSFIKDNIMAGNHSRVRSDVLSLLGKLENYDHDFARLLERELKELSYVTSQTIDKATNVLKLKKGREDNKVTLAMALSPILFGLQPFFLTVQAGQAVFGEGEDNEIGFRRSPDSEVDPIQSLFYVGKNKTTLFRTTRYYPYKDKFIVESEHE